MALPATDSLIDASQPRALATYNPAWTIDSGTWTTAASSVGASGGSDNVAHWNADAFGNDHYSQCVLTAQGAGIVPGVVVRASTAGGLNYYRFLASNSAGWVIAAKLAGVFNSVTSGATNFANGDVLLGQAVGSSPTTLSIYKNGTLVASFVDTNNFGPQSGGAPGIFTAGADAASIKTWQGDNVAAGGGGGPAPMPFTRTQFFVTDTIIQS